WYGLWSCKSPSGSVGPGRLSTTHSTHPIAIRLLDQLIRQRRRRFAALEIALHRGNRHFREHGGCALELRPAGARAVRGPLDDLGIDLAVPEPSEQPTGTVSTRRPTTAQVN